VIGTIVQLAAVVITMGTQAIIAYAATVASLPRIASVLEPDAWRMHSLKTLTNLMPPPLASWLWLGLSAVVVVLTVRAWRSRAPTLAKFGLLVMASALINPHLFVYDAVVLVLPLLWIGGWIEREHRADAVWYGPAVYGLCALLLIPTAGVVLVQGSVIALTWLFVRVATGVSDVSSTTPAVTQ
jgi:hypothetical protein